jgi:hypothetical protein
MPVLAVGAGYIPALGGNITMQTVGDGEISSKCNRDHSSKFRTFYSRRTATFSSKTTQKFL